MSDEVGNKVEKVARALCRRELVVSHLSAHRSYRGQTRERQEWMKQAFDAVFDRIVEEDWRQHIGAARTAICVLEGFSAKDQHPKDCVCSDCLTGSIG